MQLGSIVTFKDVTKVESTLKTLGFAPVADGLISEDQRLFHRTIYRLGDQFVSISHERGTVRPDPVITANVSPSVLKMVRAALE